MQHSGLSSFNLNSRLGSMMIDGGCHCGAVRYRADPPLALVKGHCRQCRQINGSACSSHVSVAEAGFSVRGDALGSHQANPRAVKHFCRSCGSATHNSNPFTYPGLVMVYLGSLDDDSGLVPQADLSCSSKRGWVDAIASQASFARAPLAAG